eukprot:gene12451-16699_t
MAIKVPLNGPSGLGIPDAMSDSVRPALTQEPSALDRLRGSATGRWPNIANARALSSRKMGELQKLAADLPPRGDGALVVFGSLARGEFTPDSDLDWALVIDGQADSRHLKIVNSLKPALSNAGFKVPGPTEVFGGLVFSHELIHAIGGDEDTNKNMTRRLLLVLESAAVDVFESKQVHDRVVTGILNRYVEEDASFISNNRSSNRIPRFLLNDVVRYWRTMAVDYANKYRARAGEKWALRNIKLRMSRKLLFVSGLLMCITWALDHGKADDEFVVPGLVNHLREWTRRRPLDSLAIVVERYAPALADDIFGSYDSFLAVLGDDEKRHLLQRPGPDDAYLDEVFLDARRVATNFDDALVWNFLMVAIGFSTGAIALGDFERALHLLENTRTDAVELSALRFREMPHMLARLPMHRARLEQRYRYVSFHAPTDFGCERDMVQQLATIAALGWNIIVHPDTIQDSSLWRPLGRQLCIENMDSRKGTGRTVAELSQFFEALPEASLCFDIAHARQVDPTMTEAAGILTAFSDRLAQVHVSEVDGKGRHFAMSFAARHAYRPFARSMSEVPVILESIVRENEIDAEIEQARTMLSYDPLPGGRSNPSSYLRLPEASQKGVLAPTLEARSPHSIPLAVGKALCASYIDNGSQPKTE